MDRPLVAVVPVDAGAGDDLDQRGDQLDREQAAMVRSLAAFRTTRPGWGSLFSLSRPMS
ncbi:hypothetical protein ACIP44_06165 [Streptomyces diastaticus]|uniref:hypothetical protein n=1 Tax=Streptomyces diastaticus TaxID=1956 RepID=UPI0037FCEA76